MSDEFSGANRYQVDAEIDALIAILQANGVRSYLEIGAKYGGSLWRIATALPPSSKIVAVDLNRNGTSLLHCIDRLRERGYNAHVIIGNSIDEATIKRAAKFGPYDALFIDGNHKLMYVQSDWENYGPMARIVAFHDIGWRRAIPGSPNRILVPEFWNSIKADYPHQEILLHPSGNAFGIGVLWRH